MSADAPDTRQPPLETDLTHRELYVLRSVYDLLEPLPPVTRERVVTYLCRVLEIEVEL